MITAKVTKEYSDILHRYVYWINIEKPASDKSLWWGESHYLCDDEEQCFKTLWRIAKKKGFRVVIDKNIKY